LREFCGWRAVLDWLRRAGHLNLAESDLMNKTLAVLLASAVMLSGAARAQEASTEAAATAAATESATRWLVLADAGKWSDTWEQMAPAAQSMVTKDAWTAAAAPVRDPLGAVKARSLQSAVFTHSPPGAPAGDYIVIRYDTEFANKGKAVETVVPMRTPDGWKVSGYFIR
jgi:hypothetical protein